MVMQNEIAKNPAQSSSLPSGRSELSPALKAIRERAHRLFLMGEMGLAARLLLEAAR